MRGVLGGFLACGLMACFVGCGDQSATPPPGSTKTGIELVREKMKDIPVPTKPESPFPLQKKTN